MDDVLFYFANNNKINFNYFYYIINRNVTI